MTPIPSPSNPPGNDRDARRRSVWKKYLGFTLKIAVAAGIVGFLFRNPREIVDCFRHFDFRYLAPALVCYGAHIFVCAWRWRELAKIIGVHFRPLEAVSLTFQGNMFSLVIPGGAIGGDVVKMGAVTRRSATGSKTEGAFTVLMDRIVGMIALFSLELAILVPAIPLLMRVSFPELALDARTKQLGILLLALLAVAGLAASGVIFFHRFIEKIPPFGRLMRWGDNVTHGTVSRLTAATDTYSASWRKLVLLTLASIFFVHLMTVLPMCFLLAGLGLEFRIFDVIVAVTIGNIIGLLPIFPGGVGGRDVAAVTLLAAAGIDVPDAKTAQLIYTALILFYGLLGAVFMVCDPGRKLDGGDGKAEDRPERK